MQVQAAPATRADANTTALAYLRIAVGVLFLIFGAYKVFGTQFTLGGGFQGWINRFIAGGAYPFMIPVLRGFVLAHATVIAFLVAYGELAIGLALVLGLLVRGASICGVIYMHLWRDLHVGAAVLVELSGAGRSAVAVLWRVAGSFRPRPLLRRVCAEHGWRGLHSAAMVAPAAAPSSLTSA